MDEFAYMTYMPVEQFGPGMTSATEIRTKWPDMRNDQKLNLVGVLYPNYANNEKQLQKLVDIIDQVLGKQVDERKLTGAEKRSKEVNFKKLKPELDDFKKRYGKDAESVMHAVATKQAKAKNEDVANEATMANTDDGILVYPDGGLGGYSPEGLERAVIRHFEEVLAQAKSGNLDNVNYLLYKGGVIESKLKALRQWQDWLEKRGKRPLAKSKTYDLANEDYLDE